ncbi:hypothetical protein GQ457_01G050630 [Hibiscus cannabinus]
MVLFFHETHEDHGPSRIREKIPHSITQILNHEHPILYLDVKVAIYAGGPHLATCLLAENAAFSSITLVLISSAKRFRISFTPAHLSSLLDLRLVCFGCMRVVEYSDGKRTTFTHRHPLKPVGLKQQKDKVVCAMCEKVCSSSSSTYGCLGCKFFLHRSCMDRIPRKLIDQPIHPCTLVCDKCNEATSSRMMFTCGACAFNLHAKCALLPTIDSDHAEEVQHFSHPHPLSLVKNHPVFGKEPEARCVACVQTCSSPTPNFQLNSDQDVYNSEAEFYCDVCEERRHKRESVYCCADCKFIAELKCITPNVTVLPLIPKTEHVQQAPSAGVCDDVGDDDDGDGEGDDERSPFCKVLYNLIKLEQKKNEAEESPWEISRALYQLRKLEQMRNEIEKLLGSVTTEIKETKDSLGMESLRI